MEQGPTISDPRLRRLYEYWLDKKGDRAAPSRADIVPEDISDILQWVFLVEVAGERFRYRLVGTRITQEYGEEFTGKHIDEVDIDNVMARVIGEYQKSAKDIVPVASTWKYTKNDGRYLEYERVILPLSSNGKTVDMFVCGAVGFGVG